MKHFIAFCRRNRLFAALLAAELAVVCALAAGLFGAPYKLALTPGDFTNTLPDIAAADEDGLKIWNQIGYHSDDPMTFSADNIALPSGAYEVTVRYFSCQTPDAPTFNMLNAAGSLTFASERSPAAVTFDALRLDDCHRSLTTRLWVGFGARMQDLTATVTYDQGQLYIYSITLTEQPIYRAARLLCFLVLFAAADAALLLLFAHVGERGAARRRALRLPLALAGITLLACLPLFSNYLYFGHDLEFHMQRIAAMAAELSYGQFPVRLTTTTLNGYGYASPLCYCELFLLLPALLYNLWLPLRTCYQVYLFAVTLATCLIAYFSFAKITASRRLGLLGALLYTLSAYRLTCVYTRAAVGEFTAMAFFPLVLLGLYGIYTSARPRFGDWLPMALGMAAMVQSHLLSCELTALLLILFCLLRLRETLRPARLLAWVKAALLTASITETNIMSAQGESSYATYNQNATINSVGTAEYLIDGASSYEAIWAQPKPASGDLHLISYEKREGVAYVSVENDGGEAAISLPIYNYGNYYAADESGAPFAITSGENMRIVLTIPAGYTGTIHVRYHAPGYWRAFEALSAVSLLGVIGCGAFARRKRRTPATV